MATRWTADPEDRRVSVELDALTAVYHRPSGTTHLLASPAPELLDALAAGPADAALLLDRLRLRFDVGDAGADAIDAQLGELKAAGLVRRL